MKENYRKQVELLIDVLPIVMADERVALKGGTAINLFHRELPRLSVDIDLCYLPIEDRETTFKNLHEILRKVKDGLESKLGLSVRRNYPLDGKREAKLIAQRSAIEVKIEPNYVLRGSLYDPSNLNLSKKTQSEFSRESKVKCLNLADTFGGKICAALDRQHPRDLFDIKILLENEGITNDIKDAFIFYLLSHNRPINELLNPNVKDISKLYSDEFINMPEEKITLDELLEARDNLQKSIFKKLSDSDKEFIVSFVKNSPNWESFSVQKIKDYPSIKWKLFNQKKMNPEKLSQYIAEVEKCLK